jgi:hypothetical protein
MATPLNPLYRLKPTNLLDNNLPQNPILSTEPPRYWIQGEVIRNLQV